MAKKETVYFALPIDEMKGKMATKQLNIQYSGQSSDETPYDLATGRHRATNFRKYVVLTHVRGKNMFYVKSRTTVNNTRYMQLAQSLMALSASLATMVAQDVQDAPDQRPYPQVLKSYDDFAPEGQTLRDYLTSKFNSQIRQNVEKLTLPVKTGTMPEIIEAVEIGNNPFYGYDHEYEPSNITAKFGETEAQKKVIQKYFAALNSIYNQAIYTLNYVSADLKKGSVKIVQSSAGASTFETLAGTVQGNSFSIEFGDGTDNMVNMTIYNGIGRVITTGEVYADETFTTPITKATEFLSGMTIYFKAV